MQTSRDQTWKLPFLHSAARVLEIEAQAIESLKSRLGLPFANACRQLLTCAGRVVVTGMGKSGHIARKIAATLASTGTPSFFMHPGEASHGDLGMLTEQDALLALSASGESEEILLFLPLLKRLNIPLIALTGAPHSTLAQAATLHLDVSVTQEACPLGLAPTASTTAALAMGDALAIALLEARGFTADDFARSHPGGHLGRKLFIKIEDVMHTGDQIPKITQQALIANALIEMTRVPLGMAIVVDSTDPYRVIGVFTDGDLRRALNQGVDVHTTFVHQVMTHPCKTILSDVLATEAVHLMERFKILALPVLDREDRLVGALNMQDLLRARVV